MREVITGLHSKFYHQAARATAMDTFGDSLKRPL